MTVGADSEEVEGRNAEKTQAVVQLAGGIAHDLNNLLMTILGNSEMLTARLEAGTPPHEMATICAPCSAALRVMESVSSVPPEYDMANASVSGPTKAGMRICFITLIGTGRAQSVRCTCGTGGTSCTGGATRRTASWRRSAGSAQCR